MPGRRIDAARRALIERNRWIGGHADVSGWFRDGELFTLLAGGLADLASPLRPTLVLALEAKGFVLGAVVARQLGLGLVLVRKGARRSSRYLETRTAPDWRRREWVLRLDRHEVDAGDRPVLVDDWLETGAQVTGARTLVEEAGGEWAGVVTVVDDCADRRLAELLGLTSLVTSAELGGS